MAEILIDYERKGDTDNSRFEVRVNSRKYQSVSHHSAYRLTRWITNQYPRVFGGGNYYGGSYRVRVDK